MGNTTTSLFQTLVAAANEASESLKYANAFMDAIYWDNKPDTAQPFSALSVIIPSVNEGDVVDIGAGILQPSDTAHTAVDITLDSHFSTSFIIKNFDQVRTPVDLSKKYFQPRLEAITRSINRKIAALVTVANFDGYTLITGSGADVFARADIAGAWVNLAGAGVPVEDTANVTLITNPLAYGNMMASTTFSSEAVVGLGAAEAALQRAVLVSQFGAAVKYDQHIANYNSGKQAGILMHRYAIAGVTAMPPSSGDFMETMIDVKGVPVQVQAQASILHGGTIVNIHCFVGVKVVRKNFASLVETT